jgi:hypothetical protein
MTAATTMQGMRDEPALPQELADRRRRVVLRLPSRRRTVSSETAFPARARAIIVQNLSERSSNRSSMSASSIPRIAATGLPLRVTTTTSLRAASRVREKLFRASKYRHRLHGQAVRGILHATQPLDRRPCRPLGFVAKMAVDRIQDPHGVDPSKSSQLPHCGRRHDDIEHSRILP